ncbi:Acyl-CoA desaturase [Psilocybe cubensis]|uniref:Acyl-CoA desaturase n=1 Tax=Psilocybe cubensis TaxID=181762 RepID=A0ACB8HEZ2_PSICU|nr:Acyl-CoA desaturase [Psilocybe cubensis]KAH9486300.1 Acyl-CoA desaturase [Psilocybe cubensis]
MSQAVKTKSASENAPEGAQPQVWWSNAVFFILVHVAAAVGVYYLPPWAVHKKTLLLWFLTWQMSDFGITIGYHRLYSHKAFRATLGVRVVLAILGSAAFQGSIKRFTDDPVHDPYAATRGLFYSHMGWIFYKPNYTRMALIEKDDLESDPGPSLADWDPSKWIIIALQQLGLVASLRRARKEDLDEAIHHMKKKASTGVDEPEDRRWDGETWNNVQVVDFAKAKTGRCIVLIDGYAVDVTAYLGQHPGGAKLLREYSIRLTSDIDSWRKADWAFKGGLNNHSRAARRQMREMRVAKLVD